MSLNAVGRPDLALREAIRLWDRSPSEELAVLGGKAALQSGRLAASLPRLEEALARYPTSEAIKTLVFLGLAFRVDDLLNRRALKEAARDLQQMRALKPDECGPYSGLAKVARLEGNDQEARHLLAEAARRDGGGACRQRAASDPLLAPLVE